MADKFYKLKDIPKEKRMAHIWEYYKWHIIALLLIFAIFSLIVQNSTKEKDDFYMLFTMSGGYLTEETRANLETGIENMSIDSNGDGYSNLSISTVLFPEDPLAPAADYETRINMQILVAEFKSGESVIQITDDKMYETLKGYEALATFESLEGFVEGEGIIKIPYNETKLEDIVPMEKYENQLYITIRPGDINNVIYREQIEIFKNLLK